jgi:hypothetical protein
MAALTWITGKWVVRVHQSGGSQKATFDEQATVDSRAYSIKKQGDSWVLIRVIDDVDDRYRVFSSADAAKQKAESWEHVAGRPGAVEATGRLGRGD